jgi:hypothetical protein
MTNIQTPTDIQQICYEGELEVTPESLNLQLKSDPKGVAFAQSYAPAVTLGQPQEWNLRALAEAEGKTLPPELSLLLQDADFYLLMLACSFRPKAGSEITFARFNVNLAPKTGSVLPLAFDLYPLLVQNEAKHEVKVKIAPSLKFSEAELSLGELLGKIEFRTIEPEIIAYGLHESQPSWDFVMSQSHPLQGSRFTYMIVKKPRFARWVIMTLSLSADIAVGQGFFRAKLRETDHAHATMEVCVE